MKTLLSLFAVMLVTACIAQNSASVSLRGADRITKEVRHELLLAI